LQISTAFASWQRYCTAVKSERQPNFAALNRGRHLCSAGRPSRWALAHISSSFFLSSPNLSCCRLDVYHNSTHGACGLSAKLGCRSEICCTQLGKNTGRKKSPKIRHLGTIAQLRSSSLYIFATKPRIDNRKNLLRYLLHMASQYDELRPTNG